MSYNIDRKDLLLLAGDKVLYMRAGSKLVRYRPQFGEVVKKIGNSRYQVAFDSAPGQVHVLPGSMLRKYCVDLAEEDGQERGGMLYTSSIQGRNEDAYNQNRLLVSPHLLSITRERQEERED